MVEALLYPKQPANAEIVVGRQLIQECPLFRQTLQRCDLALGSLPNAPEWSVIDELLRSKETSLLGQTLYSQTICTAVQLALVDLMKSWGISPSAVVGHSSGEMGAAYAAGILSFENAMIAAYYRGLYMSSGNNTDQVPGAMMAVGLTESDALEALKPYTGRLTIAAVNSPSTITISGDEDAIIELKSELDREKVFARQLQVKQAFHSHHMLPLAPAYESALRSCKGFDAQPTTCRMFSTVTARVADHHEMGAEYWATNMTNMVRFSDGIVGIVLDEYDQQNVDVLVEIGPHPALKGPCKQILQSLKMELPYVATLTRGTADFEGMLTMAGQLFSLGYPVDLAALNQNISIGQSEELVKLETGKRLPEFPSYAWDHMRYWSETRVIREHRLRRFRHSVLGHIVPGSVSDQPRWRNILRTSEIPWLAEHIIDGKTVFPGAGYISMAIEAAIRHQPSDVNVTAISLQDVSIKAPLVIPDSDEGVEILLDLRPTVTSARKKSDSWFEFSIFSYDDAGVCMEHCHGAISTEIESAARLKTFSSETNIEDLLKRTNYSTPATSFYRRLSSIGLEYGEKFKLLNGNIERGDGFAVSSLVFNPKALPSEEADVTTVHPTLLDSSFHLIFNAIESCLERTLDEPYVPSFIRSMVFDGFSTVKESLETREYQLCCQTKLLSQRVATNDMLLRDESGSTTMQINGLEVTSLGRDVFDTQKGRSLFFQQRWLPCFDLLSSHSDLSSRSLAEVVETFVHQYPNSRILHFTSSAARAKQAIGQLGLKRGQRRNVQHIDICMPENVEDVVTDIHLLASQSEVLSIGEPDGSYDLIIVSREKLDIDLASLLKGTGRVLLDDCTDAVIASSGFYRVFSTPCMSAYAPQAVETPASTDDVTVVVPNNVSERVQNILDSLKSLLPKVIPVKLQNVAEDDRLKEPGSLLVLSSLDEPPSDEKTFSSYQTILTATKKNVVWALEGATSKLDQTPAFSLPGARLGPKNQSTL